MKPGPDPVHELARLWSDMAKTGERVVLPAAVAEQLELRALSYRAALATRDRILHPGLIEFLGQ